MSVPLRLFLGFIAGSIASIANIPFDVAKSRIQGKKKMFVLIYLMLFSGPQPEKGRIYHTTWQTVLLVHRQVR